ncbi:MAG: hypothetical protein ACTS6G_01275 [Candidatus Hodgkinia cicadicola]
MLRKLNICPSCKRRSNRRALHQVLTFTFRQFLSSFTFRSLESILTKLSKLSNLPLKRHSSIIRRFKQFQFALSQRN